MDFQSIAIEELEKSAISQLASLGIRATREKQGVLQIRASLSPGRVETDIRGRIPHADIRVESDGDGTKGTVKVADVRKFNE